MGRTPELLVKVPPSIRKYLGRASLKIPSPTAEILPLQARLRPLLRSAWPDASEKEISWLTADLAGLWEVSRVHVILIRKLLKMADKRSKPDLRRLSNIAVEIDINWFSNAPGHMKTMKRELARFTTCLFANSCDRPKVRRPRKRSEA
jgi:hypothetical protein